MNSSSTSRLREYELWTRTHARGLGQSHGEAVRQLLGRVALLELAPPVLTPDALHLASAEFLRQQGQTILLASYDSRSTNATRQLGIGIYDL